MSSSGTCSATSAPGTDATHPPHYSRLDPEPIELIRRWGLGFALGCVIKYVARCDHKGNALEDLRKARYYLDHEIKAREAEADRLASS